MATIIVGDNSYVTEAELTTYATDRGATVSGDASALLIQAMDYLETRVYVGSKTDEAQDLEWPRAGTDYANTVVPQKLKDAQMTLALLYDNDEDPLGTLGPRVTQETVTGAVSVSYSDKGNQSNVYRKVNALLRPLLAGGGSAFEVRRG